MSNDVLKYEMAPGVEAFSTRKGSALPFDVILPHQVHSTKVVIIKDGTENVDGVDALITSVPGLAIGVKTADCIPILLYDPIKRVVAAVHSGWRGTLARISDKVVAMMKHYYGCEPGDLIAQIGPGIQMKSFQVGEEVADAFRQSGFKLDDIWEFEGPKVEGSMMGGHHLNLSKAVKLTLIDAGLQEGNIRDCGIDTFTEAEFYSARRETINTGRIINAIRITSAVE